jgi:hypothetical protein
MWEAAVKCNTAGGVSCEDIVYPEGSCSSGASIDVITFSYQINDCDGSQNEQEGTFRARILCLYH